MDEGCDENGDACPHGSPLLSAMAAVLGALQEAFQSLATAALQHQP